MKVLKYGLIVLFLIGGVLMCIGCRGDETGDRKDVIDGGTRDESDRTAPQIIRSENLVSFRSGFFRYADENDFNSGRAFRFKMTCSSDGIYTISEGYDDEIVCETDAAFADKLEKLIRKYDLIRLNGIQKETYGLPPEYAPYWIDASYDSGESLHFSMNGDPYADWTEAVLRLFAQEFAVHGINDLMPPAEDSVMIRFRLDYTYGDIRYRYGEILVPMTEEEKSRTLEDIAINGLQEDEWIRKAYASPWNRAIDEKISDDRMADLTEEHYQTLQEIVEIAGLADYRNGQGFPEGYDYIHTPQYFEFYIEYASGRILQGFSDDPETCEAFRPIAEEFAAYYEEFLDRNQQ